jgi:photosystem II stability/assembly factor-like uncharacterized protein
MAAEGGGISSGSRAIAAFVTCLTLSAAVAFAVCRSQNVLSTTDAGETFTSLPLAQPAALFLAAIAAQNATSACLTGVNFLAGAAQFTDDGKTFTNSSQKGVIVQQTQDIQRVVGAADMYVIAGAWVIYGVPAPGNSTNGVAISYDGGATFDWVNLETPNTPYARYGAFPSPSVGFVASGVFPNNNKADEEILQTGDIRLNHVVSIRKHRNGPKVVLNKPRKVSVSGDDSPYAGSIQRSTDGFQTFTTVYSNDTIYFNQISCSSTQTCYVVGANADLSVVLQTQDGGDSWNEVFVVPDGISLSAVQALSDSSVVVGGGVATQSGVTGYIYTSTDSGATWATEVLDGFLIYDFDFLDANNAFAVAINNQTSSNGQSHAQLGGGFASHPRAPNCTLTFAMLSAFHRLPAVLRYSA